MKKALLILIAAIFVLSLIADGTNTNVGAPLVNALPFTDTGNLSDNTDDNANRYRDEWWEITPTIDLTNVDIHPVYDGWDGYLFVYDSNLAELAYDDDGPGGTADSQIIMDIAAGQTIYVVVDEYSASTDARTFTLNISADQTGVITDADAPEMISNVNPASGSTDIALMPTLTWDFGAATETYDIFFDTVYPPVTQVVTGATSGMTGSYTPTADLVEFTTYYWQVVCHNSTTTTATVNNMNFMTLDMSPGHIENADPADGSLNIALDQVITWDFAANAETYDFYFDTVNPPVTQIVTDGTVSGPGSYTPTLASATFYYWKVVSKNSTSLRDTEDSMSFQTTLGTDVITIGNGTLVNQFLPIEPWYGYSYSQSIYMQSEINMQGRRIEKIYYQYNMAGTLANCNEWVLYLGHTANSNFASVDDWVPANQLTEVYNGPLPTIPADGWIEFVLTTPFVYNNSDNLVIAVEENQQAYATSGEEFFCTAATENRSIYFYNDSTNPDPTNPPSAMQTPAVIPNTRLFFGDIPDGAEMMINPDTNDFGTIYTNTASAPVPFMMQNTGAGILNIQSVTIDDDINYSIIDTNTYPMALNTAEGATFQVVFNPMSEGPLPATVTVTDDLRLSYQIALTGVGFNQTVAVFPYTENFDGGTTIPIGWDQGTEDAGDWLFGPNTPNWQTGPQSGDNTTGTGNFAYTQSVGTDGNRHDLLSPPLDITALTNPFCTFNYCLYGASMGSLHFDVWNGTAWVEDVIPAISGDQGLDWHMADMDLSAYTGIIQVRFRAIAGMNWQTDMALDDISFWDNGATPVASTVIAPLDGATGIGMTGTLDWTTVPGTSGYYISMGTDNPPTDVYDAVDAGNVTSYDYSGLTAGTDYYWQVVPYNAIGAATNCPIWSFTSFNDVPLAATLVFPADAAQAVIETPTLQWADGGQFPDGYRLYMGTDNPPTDLYDSEDLGMVTSYDITAPLQFETTYYWQIVPYNFVGDAINCPIWSFTTNSNQNFGGDGNLYGGYYFANSTPSGNGLGYQPIFEWVDISTTGQIPAYSNADDGFATVDIGFTFNYFGNDYTQVSLGTNGTIMFTNPTGTTNYGLTIPDPAAPNDVIAMMGEDLHTGTVPSLSYYGLDEMGNFVFTVLMWADYADPSEYMDIQVILYPTGRIKMQYQNYVNPNGDTGIASMYGDGTIGIENADGTIGHQYAIDGVGGPVNEGMSLCYALTPSDLSEGGAGLFLPGNIDFDVTNVGNNSSMFDLRIRNFGDADITIASAPVLSGDNPDQFELLDTNTYPLVVASGGEENIDVRFTPTSQGHKTAVLTIVDDYVEPDDRLSYDIPLHGYGNVPDTNNSSATATEFALYDEDVEGFEAIIEPTDDVDWYVFWQTGPAQIDIYTENMYDSSINLAVHMYGPYNDVGIAVDENASIGFDDDGGTGMNPHLVADVVNDGFYYIRIASFDNGPVVRVAGRSASRPVPMQRWETGDYALWMSTDNPIPPSGFDPPSALMADVSFQGIDLSWNQPVPEARALVGYNVYRDDVIVNLDMVTSLFHLDPATDLTIDQEYEYKVTALYTGPTGESVACDSLMVTFVSVDPPIIAEDFEAYDDFAIQFGDWTVIDVDGEDTYGFNNGIDFPGENDPMAFMVFNPISTTPPLQFADAYSGVKYATSFSADSGSNDDWLISPQIQLTDAEATIELMARSYTIQFGMEKFEVAVSMGSADPADFTVISGDVPVEAPLAWQPYSYDLAPYATEIVRIGIHCVSEQTFFMMLDDVMITNDGATVENEPQPIIPDVTALGGNYPNPFNPETAISFDLKENSDVTIDIFNIKGQRVARIADDVYTAGTHKVIWKGKNAQGNSVSSGVYFYKMQSGTYTKTKKMILMK